MALCAAMAGSILTDSGDIDPSYFANSVENFLTSVLLTSMLRKRFFDVGE